MSVSDRTMHHSPCDVQDNTADTDSDCRMSGAKLGGHQISDLEEIKFNWKEHSA